MHLRPRSFLSLFFGLWGGVSLFFIAVMLVLLVMLVAFSQKANRLAAGGVETIAVVVGKEVQTSFTSNRSRSSFVLSLRFQTASGTTVEENTSVSRARFRDVSTGDELAVRYLSSDPAVIEVGSGSSAEFVRVLRIILPALAAIAAFTFWKAWSRARRLVRLRDRGLRRKVVVLEHLDTGIDTGKKRLYRAAWQEAGDRIGATGPMLQSELPPLGSEIVVFTDPDGKGPSIWEGDLTRA